MERCRYFSGGNKKEMEIARKAHTIEQGKTGVLRLDLNSGKVLHPKRWQEILRYHQCKTAPIISATITAAPCVAF